MPFDELSLDEDIRELFRSVLKQNSSERPTAYQLLRHQLIRDGESKCVLSSCGSEVHHQVVIK